MYDDFDDDDRSDWQKSIDDATKERLHEMVPGVPLDEVDDDLFREAQEYAADVVGPDPDAPSDDLEEE